MSKILRGLQTDRDEDSNERKHPELRPLLLHRRATIERVTRKSRWLYRRMRTSNNAVSPASTLATTCSSDMACAAATTPIPVMITAPAQTSFIQSAQRGKRYKFSFSAQVVTNGTRVALFTWGKFGKLSSGGLEKEGEKCVSKERYL